MFKVNKGNTITMCEIGSKLAMNTPQRRDSGSCSLSTFHTHSSGVSTVDFDLEKQMSFGYLISSNKPSLNKIYLLVFLETI